jgi:hypothetical protein
MDTEEPINHTELLRKHFIYTFFCSRLYIRPPLSSGDFRRTSGRPSEWRSHRTGTPSGLLAALLVRCGMYFPLGALNLVELNALPDRTLSGSPVQNKSCSSLDSGSGVQSKSLGLPLGLGLWGPSKAKANRTPPCLLGLGLWDPKQIGLLRPPWTRTHGSSDSRAQSKSGSSCLGSGSRLRARIGLPNPRR